MKILFIHGLASSGAYKTADTLRMLLKPCEVISPDIPIEPDKALALLRELCLVESPDLVVGLSLGGFWAQKLRGYRKILINPGFHASRLMRTMMGEVKYLSPRKDGALSFTITEEICDEYEAMEDRQFEDITPEEVSMTAGLFADHDEIVHCRDEFALHYPGKAYDFPGTHLPGFPQIKKYFLPIAREMMESDQSVHN